MSPVQPLAKISRAGSVILVLAWGLSAWASEPSTRNNLPFNVEREESGFKIYTMIGKKPLSDSELLPPAPRPLPRVLSTSELAQVSEVGLEDPLPKTWNKQEALQHMEFRFAKVNYFNLKKTDGFLHALLAQRPDLVGLPFKMGLDCRLPQEKALALGMAIGMVHASREKERFTEMDDPLAYQGLTAALMQIHGPKEKQIDLTRTLSIVPDAKATTALARLALFSPDARAREVAAQALKIRREQDYTGILLDGFHYPLPVVARRAAEALVRLERKDLLPRLVEVLEKPDPRLPIQNPEGWHVRELVRINHHRNCLLCHAPAHTKAILKVPADDKEVTRKILAEAKNAVNKLDERENLLAPVPLPNLPFDLKSGGYRGDSELEHILVRVDVTYLRQDFSMLLPVEDAAPWPDFQRFDFLVRTRALSETEAANLRKRLQPQGEGQISPYHQAALFCLRELTGLEATKTSDWRRLLKLPFPETQSK